MMRNQYTFTLFRKRIALVVLVLYKGLRLYLLGFMMLRSDLLFFYSSSHLRTALIISQPFLTSCTGRAHPFLFLISLPVESEQPFLHFLIKHSPIIICLLYNKVYLS